MNTGLCSDGIHAVIPTNLPDLGPSLFSVGSIKLPTLIYVRKGCMSSLNSLMLAASPFYLEIHKSSCGAKKV